MSKSAQLDASLMEKIIESMIELKSATKALAFHGVNAPYFYAYLSKNPSAENDYMRAQAAVAELMAEEIVDISDTENDSARARNRIDARKWYASKTKPQKFGERIDLNINQVVDIGAALTEARSRVVTELPQVKQAISIVSESRDESTGCQPVDPNENESDDIYD